MCLFIESICYKNGIKNLELHQERINRVFKKFYPDILPINLEEKIKDIKLPNDNQKYKIRILYSSRIVNIKYEKYKLRKIKKLFIVFNNQINYEYKFADRKAFEEIKRDKEEVIIIKNGFITDTTFTNIILASGNKLFTPTTPLLKGIKRELLLKEGIIKEEEIRLKDLKFFDRIYLVNSMLDIGEIEIKKENIID